MRRSVRGGDITRSVFCARVLCIRSEDRSRAATPTSDTEPDAPAAHVNQLDLAAGVEPRARLHVPTALCLIRPPSRVPTRRRRKSAYDCLDFLEGQLQRFTRSTTEKLEERIVLAHRASLPRSTSPETRRAVRACFPASVSQIRSEARYPTHGSSAGSSVHGSGRQSCSQPQLSEIAWHPDRPGTHGAGIRRSGRQAPPFIADRFDRWRPDRVKLTSAHEAGTPALEAASRPRPCFRVGRRRRRLGACACGA